jgi:hypothetical protein
MTARMIVPVHSSAAHLMPLCSTMLTIQRPQIEPEHETLAAVATFGTETMERHREIVTRAPNETTS